jgi:DNA recombination protein RmuC
MLIGVVIIVVNKQLKLDQLVGLLGSLLTLAGVSVAMYGLLDTMRGGRMKKEKPESDEVGSEVEIEKASRTKELEGRLPIPLGSVTDRTTQLIGVDSEHRTQDFCSATPCHLCNSSDKLTFMDSLIPVFTLIFGAIIGAVVAWLTLHARSHRAFDDGRAASTAELAALQERIAAKDRELQKLQGTFEAEVSDSDRLREDNARLLADLEGERRAAHERNESFKRVTAELAEKFKALSRDALKDNNQEFLNLARATLERFQVSAKGDLDQRQQAIDQMVKPLKESLEKVDGKIEEMERIRAGAYSGLIEQVKTLASSHQQLQAETGNLVKALRTPHVRGRWGEIQLRRVVELAGMIQYCDFAEQETIANEDGRIRPDVIVRLPGNRTIVIDAKVPFEAFYESISTADDSIRLERLKDHARLVRTHIVALSRKSYWEAVQPTPEFVLLFLPGESFYSAALEQDPKLIEDGINQRVIIATPTTLIALLKAISYGWQQEQRAANADEVGKLGKELYDRLRTFLSHFSDIGRNLDRALEFYNKGVASLDTRVLVTARKLKDRNAISGEEIESPEPVDKRTRPLSLDEGGLFPELAAPADTDEDDLPPLLRSRSARAGEKQS